MRKPLLSLVAAGTLLATLSGAAVAAGCPPEANFGCLLTGSASYGWKIENNSTSTNATGVYGRMSSAAAASGSAGVRGLNSATSSAGYGVWGTHNGSGAGVYGNTANGTGVFGRHSGETGTLPGVRGDTASLSANAAGVVGQVVATNAGVGAAGVRGINNSTDADGYGVRGTHAGGGYGVGGTTVSGIGVYGVSTTGVGVGGISDYIGVVGHSTDHVGVDGTSGYVGVKGTSVGSDSGIGMWGVGMAANSWGVTGEARDGVDAYGVVGVSDAGTGVYGENETAVKPAVEGVAFAAGGTATRGEAVASNGTGIAGVANVGAQAVGVRGASSTGYAGYFQGKVHVTGNLTSGGSAMLIDHPLDPANAYLAHAAVESPEMKTVYDGVATLDARGAAIVELPAYFEALNRDFRYQLTAIGAPGPQLYIADKIKGNRFKIAGGTAGMEVSWQVTGIRHDDYAEEHRTAVERAKPPTERGTYLYPEAHGQPGQPTTIERQRLQMEADR